MSDIAIKVKNLSKCYHIYDTPRDRLKQFVLPRLQGAIGAASKQYFREFWALKDVSFEVKKGETVGIIGRNGSGKSTLLQLICGTLSPTAGSVTTQGRVAALLELGSGFNPEFTGRENVYMNGAVLGLSQEEIDRRFNDISAFANIGEFIEQPVKTYSSGMVVRLAFAVYAHTDPNILIVDEALAVGDMLFQQKCFQRIEELQAQGTTLLFVSHDIHLVKQFCTNAIYLDRGLLKFVGATEIAAEKYLFDVFLEQTKGRNEQLQWRQDAESGRIGFGSKRGRIGNVCLLGEASIGNSFQQNESIRITVDAESSADIRNPEFVCQIRDARGYVIYGLASDQEELHISFDQSKMSIRSVFTVPLRLAPGKYAVSIGLNDRQGATIFSVLDKAIAVAEFSILGRGDEKFHGCVNLHGQWGKEIRN